jgi:hypothetical protein
MEKRRNPGAKFGSVDNVLDTSSGHFLSVNHEEYIMSKPEQNQKIMLS